MKHETETIDLSPLEKSPREIRKRNLVWANLRRDLTIYLIFIFIFYFAISLSEVFVGIWITWFAMPIFYLFLKTNSWSGDDNREEKLAKFAKINNFEFLLETDYSPNGVITQIGNDDHQTKNLFHGNMYGYEYAFYWHSFTVNQGGDDMPYCYGVVEIELPKRLPHIFIDCRANHVFKREVLAVFLDNERIMLEGDFNKYFQVYGLEKYAASILTILNPYFMQELINNVPDYDIEFKDRSVFLYFPNNKSPKTDNIMQLLTAAEFFIVQMQKQLDTFSYEPDIQTGHDLEQSLIKRVVRRLL